MNHKHKIPAVKMLFPFACELYANKNQLCFWSTMHVNILYTGICYKKAIRDINMNNKLLENKSNIKAGLC